MLEQTLLKQGWLKKIFIFTFFIISGIHNTELLTFVAKLSFSVFLWHFSTACSLAIGTMDTPRYTSTRFLKELGR